MKNSKDGAALQAENDVAAYDPETGEIHNDPPQPDGSIILPKITMATIRANPERCKLGDTPRPMKMALVTGLCGGEYLMPPIDAGPRIEAMGEDAVEYMTFSALVAAVEPWGCIRFDDAGEPDGLFRSDYLFLPVDHNTYIKRRRIMGQVSIAIELWAQPASNPRGYSWYLVNLATYDHGVSAVDRMLRLGVQRGREIADQRGHVGLLADLRR